MDFEIKIGLIIFGLFFCIGMTAIFLNVLMALIMSVIVNLVLLVVISAMTLRKSEYIDYSKKGSQPHDSVKRES